VKDQSHKDEMSKALRGDFERLRERGVATTLTQAPSSASAADTSTSPPDEVPDAVEDDTDGQARAGLLSRLLGR
jgi:hypothetical protein